MNTNQLHSSTKVGRPALHLIRCLAATAVIACTLHAAPPEDASEGASEPRPPAGSAPRPGPRLPPPPPPLLGLFDTDRDGVISAAEIAAAPEALRKLDSDGDGQVSGQELPRPRPPMHPRPPRPPGPQPEAHDGNP